LANRYAPLSVVTAICGVSRAGLAIVTDAPGNTEPLASETLPKISPACVWPDALVAANEQSASAATIAVILIASS
jgi:hypothetical protein